VVQVSTSAGTGAEGRPAGETAGAVAEQGRLRVAVTGAAGRMGREVVQAVGAAPDLVLVGAVEPAFAAPGARASAEEQALLDRGVATFSQVAPCLEKTRPDVLVDFTTAQAAPTIIRAALERGVRVVSGTTGIPPTELAGLARLCDRLGLGAVIVPNFSLGAAVLAILARTAAPYFRAAEIVELHHDAKRDAPSGTALALARLVGRHLAGRAPTAIPAGEAAPLVAAGRDETAAPSRGLDVDGVPVHSVRLSGLVAHHELLFASTGETLSLRHDSTSRACFMPGVLLAVRSVPRLRALVTSLEALLEMVAGGR